MPVTAAAFVKIAVAQMFEGLDRSLAKCEAFVKDKGLEESVALDWRIAPDMFPLKRQVAIATELPARALSRLAGADIPDFGGDIESFADCYARTKKSRDIIMGLSSEAIEADPEAIIALPSPRGEREFPRQVLLHNFIIPNLYFHVSAAYLHLRNMGVDIGKMDFLAAPAE